MDIKTRLTLQFSGISSFILILASLIIYFLSSKYRKDEFYQRLSDKGSSVGQLLVNFKGIDSAMLGEIEAINPTNLSEEKIYILNAKAQIVFRKPFHSDIYLDPKLIEGIRKNTKIEVSNKDIQTVGFLLHNDNQEYIIVASAIDKFGFSKMKNLRDVLMLVCSGSFLLFILAGRIYAGRALLPISHMVDKVNEIDIQNLDTRIQPVKEQDELGKLAATFNKMLARLEKAFKSQKNFIANASHELRTPLTAISGQLEVQLMQKRSAEEYRATMESILEDIRNLNQISNKLLMLAHASAEDAFSEFKPVRLDEVIWQARQELLKTQSDYNVQIEFKSDLSDDYYLSILGNEYLLKTAISNLMDNACKYSNNKTVLVEISHTETSFIVTFTDHGIGIHWDDLPFIFQPFYRSNKAIAYKGHGIGLSLVEKIIQMHMGRIEVDSNDKVTVFKLNFPLGNFKNKEPINYSLESN